MVCCSGKSEIVEFMGIYPAVRCDHWTIIRTKVMNEQMAVKNRLKKYC